MQEQLDAAVERNKALERMLERLGVDVGMQQISFFNYGHYTYVSLQYHYNPSLQALILKR